MVYPISTSPCAHPFYFTLFGLISQCIFLSTYQLRKVFDVVEGESGQYFTPIILSYSVSSVVAAIVYTFYYRKKLIKRRYGIYSLVSLMLLFYSLLILVVSGAITVQQKGITIVSSIGLGQVDYVLSEYAGDAAVVKPSREHVISSSRASVLTILRTKYLCLGAALSYLFSAIFVALVDWCKKDITFSGYIRAVSTASSDDFDDMDGLPIITEAINRADKYIVGYATLTLSLIVAFLLCSIWKFSWVKARSREPCGFIFERSLSYYEPRESDPPEEISPSIRHYTVNIFSNSVVNTFCLLNLYKIWHNGIIPVPLANVYYGAANLAITILIAFVFPRLYSCMTLNQMYAGSLVNVLLIPAMTLCYKHTRLQLKGNTNLVTRIMGSYVMSFLLINAYIILNGILGLIPKLQCIDTMEPHNRKVGYRYIIFAQTLGIFTGSIINTSCLR